MFEWTPRAKLHAKKNTLGCLDQYMCRGLRMETEKKSGPWSNLSKCNLHAYYELTLLFVYYSSGQIIHWNLNRVKKYFPPNLEILPSGQGEWNSHAYHVFTLVLVNYSSGPKLILIVTMLRWLFPPNLEIIPWIAGDLSHGQAQNGGKVLVIGWIWPWKSNLIAP